MNNTSKQQRAELESMPGISDPKISVCCLFCALTELQDVKQASIIDVASKPWSTKDIASHNSKKPLHGLTSQETRAVVATSRYVLKYSKNDSSPLIHPGFFSNAVILESINNDYTISKNEIKKGDILEIFTHGTEYRTLCFKLSQELYQVSLDIEPKYDCYHGVQGHYNNSVAITIDPLRKICTFAKWKFDGIETQDTKLSVAGNVLIDQLRDLQRVLTIEAVSVVIVSPLTAILGTKETEAFPGVQSWLNTFEQCYGGFDDIIIVFLVDCKSFFERDVFKTEDIKTIINRDVNPELLTKIHCLRNTREDISQLEWHPY